MKLLVSDYDGTFNSDLRNLRINIKTIEKFRKKGNKFVINTGRCYESIKKEIDLYKIKYDYLVCNNGLIVFDCDNNILTSSCLSNNKLNLINSYIDKNNYVKKKSPYDFYSISDKFENVLELCISFKNIKSTKLAHQELSSMHDILCYRYLNKIFISNNITKSDAVSFIQNLENVSNEDIYTVGDNKNDLEMLQDFNGYKMLYSYPCLWFKKIKTTREVHTLVKKINKR